MSRPVIDITTGAIYLNDGYSICPAKSEEDITTHFGMPLEQPLAWGGAYYHISGIDAGVEQLNVNLTFIHRRLKSVSIYLILPEAWLQQFNSQRTGFGPSEKECAISDRYEEWLTGQTGTQRKFSWGTIEVLFAKLPDGMGTPMIQLQYE